MKFLITSFLFMSAALALDYDPKFHIKHRYNKHEKVTTKAKVPPAQKMEASETSEEPLKTTPDTRKIFKKDQKD